MISYLRSLYTWISAGVHTPYAAVILGILFYLEAILFLPIDPLLAIYCFERQNRALFFATIATIASVLGGLTSYTIGFLLWNSMGQQIIHNKIINYVLTPERFEYLAQLLRTYEWRTLLITAIPFIPYKAVTLTAGFCKLSLMPFIVCSCIARGLRFYSVAITIQLFGVQIKNTLNRSLNLVLVCSIVVLIALYIIKNYY
jgi:membrane protein YqaA with SNARE-associated domain